MMILFCNQAGSIEFYVTVSCFLQVIRREPGALGARRWSMYSRLYLRHFNELDHEFTARLNRGYKCAEKYMNSFVSPALTIIAK